MSRINEYTPLKLELLDNLELESQNLDSSIEEIDQRLDNANDAIDQLDEDIHELKVRLDNISQTVSDVGYQSQVAADTLQVKLRKSIVAAIDATDNTQPDLATDYSELLDPENEYYGFSEGSAWFILES